jgi:hypothetical protein
MKGAFSIFREPKMSFFYEAPIKTAMQKLNSQAYKNNRSLFLRMDQPLFRCASAPRYLSHFTQDDSNFVESGAGLHYCALHDLRDFVCLNFVSSLIRGGLCTLLL